MKITKLAAVLALSFITVGIVAQEKKQATKEKTTTSEPATPGKSNGNADAMRRNLNFPNATNPADHNNQKYDKGTGRVENIHSEDNLGNHYNRKQLEEKK
jgi:hypothetical protein